MKKYFILSLCLLLAGNSFALPVRYQGEVQMGYGFAVGSSGLNHVGAQMINGVRITPYFSGGIGVGINHYSADGASYLALPIFANVKGYLPILPRISLFASLDYGYSVSLSGEKIGDWKGDVKGLFITPALGASFKVFGKHSLNLSVGYNSQKVAYSYQGTSGTNNAGAVAIKAGYAF